MERAIAAGPRRAVPVPPAGGPVAPPLAGVVPLFASSAADGLERVAEDWGSRTAARRCRA